MAKKLFFEMMKKLRFYASNARCKISAAAILSSNGNIYTGVCIDTACSIGMCAERNALSTMITNGESQIEKVVCIGSKGNIMLPCGVCREFMMQLNKENGNAKILSDFEKLDIITLDKLLPNWWN